MAGWSQGKERSIDDDPMVENILIAMNNEDYASFSKDFDEVMKRELPEESFTDFLEAVNGAIGDYIKGSKNLTGVNIENGITSATYLADFIYADAVIVSVYFQKISGEMKVVGLWF